MRLRSTFWPTLALLLVSVLLVPHPARAEVLDRIVAVVNDGIMLQSDLEREMEYTANQLSARGIEVPDMATLRSQVLEKQILTRIQTQRAAKAGIRVDDRELNEVLTTIARQNNMSLTEFADTIRADGGDYLAIREQIRDEVIITRLRQREVDSRVLVTDQDIDLFLAGQPEQDDTEYHLTHILVAVPDSASPEVRDESRKEARALRQRLQDGADFAGLAVAHSDGQQALQGGDLDWRNADSLPLVFLQAARTMEPGDVSELLETSGGYHLIKLVDTRSTGERKTVDETRARHILIQANTLRTEDQAQAQIRDLHQRLQDGADFAELAEEFSDDPGSRNNGGDLGWQSPGMFVPEFQDVLDALDVNEMSSPFRSQFGWHIAQVQDRRTRDITDESRRANARGTIHKRKAAEEYETWLRRLRAEAYVEFRAPDGTVIGTDVADATSS